MLVHEKVIEDKVRLDFKYKIQSGASEVKNYGLALARTLRFPSSLIDRADELINTIENESVIPFLNDTNTKNKPQDDCDNDVTMEDETSKLILNATQEINGLERDVIDLYSYVLLLMSTEKNKKFDHISIEIINNKLAEMINIMSPELRELLNQSSLDEIIGILNSSKSFSM